MISGRTPVVAIDGPAASGKGTLARRLAEALGFAHLDTGLLYRAVGLVAAEGGHHADPEQFIAAARRLSERDLERPDLRGDGAARLASIERSARPRGPSCRREGRRAPRAR